MIQERSQLLPAMEERAVPALALSLPPRDPTPALKAHILAESDRP
jgi:hypothetical protein